MRAYYDITGKAATDFGDLNTKEWLVGYKEFDSVTGEIDTKEANQVNYDNPFWVEESDEN